MPGKRRKGRQSPSVSVQAQEPQPQESQSQEKKDLILAGTTARKGVLECDYCRTDISWLPRIRCAVCVEFDLCLDCFATTDPSAVKALATAAASASTVTAAATASGSSSSPSSAPTPIVHDHTHGYRVSDRTRFPIFPAIRSVVLSTDNTQDNDDDDDDEGRSPQPSESSKDNEPMADVEGAVAPESVVKDPAVRVDMDVDMETKVENPSRKKQKLDDTDQPCNEEKVAPEETTPIATPSLTKDSTHDNSNNKQKSMDKEINESKVSETDEKKEKGETESAQGASDEAKQTPPSAELELGQGKEADKENNTLDLKGEGPTSKVVATEGSSISSDDVVDAAVSSASEPKLEWVVNDDVVKNLWTAEEDLRLLDAIKTLGLGNWAEIAEVISSTGGSSSAKSARRCMERYFDDFLGRYGHILPKYTLVEQCSSDPDDNDDATAEDGVIASGSEDLTTESEETRLSKRKRTPKFPVFRTMSSGKLSVASSSVSAYANDLKKYKVVETCTLPGYSEAWPDPFVPPVPNVKMGDDVGRDHAYTAEMKYVKATSAAPTKEEADKMRQEWMETKLKQIGGPTVLPMRLEDITTIPGSELAGFMPRRGDFDLEWDNEADTVLADMEFSPNDHAQDRQLKLQIIEIYNAKLDERERRKKFLVDRDLLDYRANQAAHDLLPPDEQDLIARMRLFARFHTPEEHQTFIQDLLKAKRLRKEIAQLQMYRQMGIQTLVEAEKYELDKSRREHHRLAHLKEEKEKEQAEATAKRAEQEGSMSVAGVGATTNSSSSLWKQYKSSDRTSRRSINRRGDIDEPADTTPNSNQITLVNGPASSTPDQPNVEQATSDKQPLMETPKDASSSGPAASGSSLDSISKAPGHELLSSKELDLCKRIQLLPTDYLEVKRGIIQESLTRGLLDKEGAKQRSIVTIDVEQRENVIDFVVRAGWISCRPTASNIPVVTTDAIPSGISNTNSATNDVHNAPAVETSST
eukprot:scaffold54173_cov50-Attheya_sp.AAC.1